MKGELNIPANMLTWAVARAGYDLAEFITKFPRLEKWLNGEKSPTFKQLEVFSKKVYLPLGYLFLPEPPREKLPIPFFRTNAKQAETVSINVYDTILIMQQRQDWLKDYLQENDFEKLPFVGKFINVFNVDDIVRDIRETLNLTENWASNFATWQEAQDHLILNVEDKGIITVFNGVVENNGHRKIPVDECRGFVLVDQVAPFMFINNSDSKAAQMFTIVHELAHIWTGHSAGFDFRKLEPANDSIEILCDKVAAEFLVPANMLDIIWQDVQDFKRLSRYFKVSEIVIARRALDTNKISKQHFLNFYNEYINREIIRKEAQPPGGDFYATTRKRLSPTFAYHVNNAIKSNQLLYRDAYKLTSLKGDTFQTFFTKHL